MVTSAGPFHDFRLGKLWLEPLCHDMHGPVVDKLTILPTLFRCRAERQQMTSYTRHNVVIISACFCIHSFLQS